MLVPLKTLPTKNTEHNNKPKIQKVKIILLRTTHLMIYWNTHSKQGLYLKGLRMREGYMQKKLGELIRVSQNNISAMEHGTRPIGEDIAQRFANVFKVKYQRFFLDNLNFNITKKFEWVNYLKS